MTHALTNGLLEKHVGTTCTLENLWVPAPHIVPDGVKAFSINLPRLEHVVRSIPLDFLPKDIQHSVMSRRIEYLGGRLYAEQCLLALGQPMQVIPRLRSGMPAWPRGVFGSVTHSHSAAHAVAHLRSDLHLGIDSESLLDLPSCDAVLQTCCTSSEKQLVERQPIQAASTLTILFTAKEAFFKAAYPILNRFMDFLEIEIIMIDSVRQTLAFRSNSHDLKYFAAAAEGCYRLGASAIHASVVIKTHVEANTYVSGCFYG